ncbi:MAG TPA: HEAT repeat domain-containing protein [Spirillospora sp.]
MADDLDSLIEMLRIWVTDDYGGDSPRDSAVAALAERSDEAVPALVRRLDELLDASARYRERLAELLRVWNAWYSEGYRLQAEHGAGVDIEPFRTVRTESLPPASIRDEYQDPVHLKKGIIEALHRIGDARAADVLVSALEDRACASTAALALRDIRSDRAVPALLDAVARTEPRDRTFRDILGTLNEYGVSPAQVRERFDVETSPLGRVSLWHLLTRLDEAQAPSKTEIRDALVFLAVDIRKRSLSREAVTMLRDMDGLPAPGFTPGNPSDSLPSDIIEEGLALAAQGRPQGHDHVLLGNLRHVGHTPAAKRAAEAILTRASRETDVPLSPAVAAAPAPVRPVAVVRADPASPR